MTSNLVQRVVDASKGNQHLMLLYDDEILLEDIEAEYVGELVRSGSLCICMRPRDCPHSDRYLSKVANRVVDLQRHIRDGDLVMMDLLQAIDGDAKLDFDVFGELKAQIERLARWRSESGKPNGTVIVGDVANMLSKKKQFEECVKLENWWQKTFLEWKGKDMDISIICTHPSSALDGPGRVRSRISDAHSSTLEINPASSAAKTSILIADSSDDMHLLYRRYFSRFSSVELVIVKDAKKCLEHVLLPDGGDGSSLGKPFDAVVIDSHIRDASGLHVAKKILEEKPEQKIVFTTTWSPESMKSELRLHSLDMFNCSVLQKPFPLKELFSLIKPAAAQPGAGGGEER
jgi:CheY-like chemotaxis protein